MAKKVTKAVFPVAGLGTRFLPVTKSLPKEMLTVVDKPLIQYAVEEAMEAGIEEMVMVTAPGARVLKNYYGTADKLVEILQARDNIEALTALSKGFPDPEKVKFRRQNNPRGLGHAIWCARDFIGNDPFAVLLPDDLMQAEPGCLSQMMDAYKETGGNVVAVEEVPKKLTSRYGILDVAEDDGCLARAMGLVEKPSPKNAPSTLAIIGRYILQPEVLEHLNKKKTGAGGEIQLTDALAATLDRIPFHGLRINGKRYDCGSKKGFFQANSAFFAARSDW